MIGTIVVMPGRASFNLRLLHSVANEFGWRVEVVENPGTPGSAPTGGKRIAALFHRSAFESDSWLDALRLVRSALPRIRPIACHAFSDAPDWPQLSGEGAFHSLWLPLKEAEVRQSFGFIAEAESRESKAARTLPIVIPVRNSSTERGISRHMARSAPRVLISRAG